MLLHIVRHGQANASGLNYDELSPQGWNQARTLGRHLSQSGVEISGFACGTLLRHRQTLQGIQEGLQTTPASPALPGTESSLFSEAIQEEEGLNEISPELWKSLALSLAEKEASFSQMLDQLKQSQGRGRKRRLAAITGRVLEHWIRASGSGFDSFRAAVIDSVARIVNNQKRGDLLMVSSGTPIAILIAKSLGSSDPDSILHWLRRLGNTSHSIIECRSEWKPLQLNSLQHLAVIHRTLM